MKGWHYNNNLRLLAGMCSAFGRRIPLPSGVDGVPLQYARRVPSVCLFMVVLLLGLVPAVAQEPLIFPRKFSYLAYARCKDKLFTS